VHTDFAFPNVGDAIEICLDGLRGRRFEVRGVHEAPTGRLYVAVHLPCEQPECVLDHDQLFPATAVRPWRAS
jgi:hypothetical protein